MKDIYLRELGKFDHHSPASWATGKKNSEVHHKALSCQKLHMSQRV